MVQLQAGYWIFCFHLPIQVCGSSLAYLCTITHIPIFDWQPSKHAVINTVFWSKYSTHVQENTALSAQANVEFSLVSYGSQFSHHRTGLHKRERNFTLQRMPWSKHSAAQSRWYLAIYHKTHSALAKSRKFMRDSEGAPSLFCQRIFPSKGLQQDIGLWHQKGSHRFWIAHVYTTNVAE